MHEAGDNTAALLSLRFKDFMARFPGAESIDELLAPNPREGSKRADYFLCNRTVILELKELKAEVRWKIDRHTEQLSEREDWPLIYGKAELASVLRHLPDAPAITEAIYRNVSRSIEKAFKKAARQIGETRKLFRLPDDAGGLLVLLNQGIEDLGPDIVAHRVGELLVERREDGSLRYGNVRSVVLITESHFVRANSLTRPLLIIDGPRESQANSLRRVTDELVRRWAAFNGASALYGRNIRNISEVQFQSETQWSRDHGPRIKRHELWRRQYRQNPYLRGLEDEAVLEHGRRLLDQMKPHFLGTQEKLPDHIVLDLMVGWTHFLEEAAIRGLDLSGLRP